MTSAKGFIYDNQETLFGARSVIGFGSDDFHVKLIDRSLADFLIDQNHYSATHVNNSNHHIGVFSCGELCGVLQFGPAMNPMSCGSVVSGTMQNEYLELNRMWICDSQGKNTESKTISYCIKTLKNINPELAWIQSFSDERCGRFGVVYQASNFVYCGSHKSIVWELEGKVYHNSMMTRNPALARSAKYLQDKKSHAKKHEFNQFRYIFFIKRGFKKRLLLTELPYPKHNDDDIGRQFIGVKPNGEFGYKGGREKTLWDEMS